jgi:hypothetical protein
MSLMVEAQLWYWNSRKMMPMISVVDSRVLAIELDEEEEEIKVPTCIEIGKGESL